MKKHLIYYRVDEICSEDISKENKADDLLCFWGELRGPLEKEYFINRVFMELSYFPKEIKENEELLKEADDVIIYTK